MFHYFSVESRISADQPARQIENPTESALSAISAAGCGIRSFICSSVTERARHEAATGDSAGLAFKGGVFGSVTRRAQTTRVVGPHFTRQVTSGVITSPLQTLIRFSQASSMRMPSLFYLELAQACSAPSDAGRRSSYCFRS